MNGHVKNKLLKDQMQKLTQPAHTVKELTTRQRCAEKAQRRLTDPKDTKLKVLMNLPNKSSTLKVHSKCSKISPEESFKLKLPRVHGSTIKLATPNLKPDSTKKF